jgi:putative ABC transport system ATP-binding protein
MNNIPSWIWEGDYMPVVDCQGLVRDYALGKTIVHALRNVSLSVDEGDFLAIVGSSGSGKTTLLNMIGCIDTPDGGTVSIDGQPTGGLSSDDLADVRSQKIGFIFQTFNLIPVLSAVENVEYPLLRHRLSSKERRDRALHALEMVELGHVGKNKPNELSGGQRQRVAIARALAVNPRIVLADEPTANLDHKTGLNILHLMKRINKQAGTTFIFSTHDPKVMELAERLVELEDGEITTVGTYRRWDPTGALAHLSHHIDDIIDNMFEHEY